MGRDKGSGRSIARKDPRVGKDLPPPWQYDWLLPFASCPLPIVYCLPFTAFCCLPSVCSLFPTP